MFSRAQLGSHYALDIEMRLHQTAADKRATGAIKMISRSEIASAGVQTVLFTCMICASRASELLS